MTWRSSLIAFVFVVYVARGHRKFSSWKLFNSRGRSLVLLTLVHSKFKVNPIALILATLKCNVFVV